MNESLNNYHISFFKPVTPQARANRNMVVWFFSIWAIAIFGFQVLLRITEEPRKEDVLVSFENVWPQIERGNATTEEFQVFTQSVMSVLGKVMIKPEDRAVLDNAVSWGVSQLTDSATLQKIILMVKDFETIKSNIQDLRNEDYLVKKRNLSAVISPMLGLTANDARYVILPLELKSTEMETFKADNRALLPSIMSLYLTHNQSVITDMVFLGFPFHYFYTAFFLLVLFVGLCLLYCLRTDKINKAYNIVD